jgi:hypothetical protein
LNRCVSFTFSTFLEEFVMKKVLSKVNIAVFATLLALGAAVGMGLLQLEPKAVACDDPIRCG